MKSSKAGGFVTLVAAYLLFFVIIGGVVTWLAVVGPPPSGPQAAAPQAASHTAPSEASASATLHPTKPTADDDTDVVSIDGTEAAKASGNASEPAPTVPKQPAVESFDPALVKDTPQGKLPVVGPNGKTAWQTYAQPFKASEDGPRIAIVVEDLGLNKDRTEDAINKLPAQVTLAFSPYAETLQDWADEARAAGHEVLLSIPMEPVSYPDDDPGPDALLTSLSPQQNLERLRRVLGRVTGYVGVMNSMGSKFTASTTALTPVMQDLSHRGLLFVDSSATRLSVAAKIARSMDIPRAINNRYIDNQITATAIDSQLTQLEQVAQGYGAAVGLSRAYPLSIERLQAWIPTLKGKGIVLAPITAVVNRQPIR